ARTRKQHGTLHTLRARLPAGLFQTPVDTANNQPRVVVLGPGTCLGQKRSSGRVTELAEHKQVIAVGARSPVELRAVERHHGQSGEGSAALQARRTAAGPLTEDDFESLATVAVLEHH